MKNTHPVETLPERYKQMVSKSASYINEDVEDIALRLHAEIEKKLIVSFSPAVYGAYLTYSACKLLDRCPIGDDNVFLCIGSILDSISAWWAEVKVDGRQKRKK
jgi:hypothetical protein